MSQNTRKSELMEKKQDFHETTSLIRRLSIILFSFFIVISMILIYLMADPSLSTFKTKPKEELVSLTSASEDDDFDKIENGIHLRTGFAEGEGLMVVVNNCTNCHSAKLVTQNRMSIDGWRVTIKWMQETQNLWDLGKNEDIIINYLAPYYAPESKGRRQNLNNIEWYELKN